MKGTEPTALERAVEVAIGELTSLATASRLLGNSVFAGGLEQDVIVPLRRALLATASKRNPT